MPDDLHFSHHSSKEELNALRNRISLHQKDTVVWKEPKNISLFTLEICTEKIIELVAGLDRFYLIVDLSEAGRPDMEYINALKIKMLEMAERGMQGIFIYFEKNIMIRSVAKYVAARIGIPVFSVSRTLEEALSEIQKRRNI